MPLATAAKRGVRVRVVTDNYNRTDAGKIDSSMWATLRQAGIISIDDDGEFEPSEACPININTAEASLLKLLPGIGTKTMDRLRPNIVVE